MASKISILSGFIILFCVLLLSISIGIASGTYSYMKEGLNESNAKKVIEIIVTEQSPMDKIIKIKDVIESDIGYQKKISVIENQISVDIAALKTKMKNDLKRKPKNTILTNILTTIDNLSKPSSILLKEIKVQIINNKLKEYMEFIKGVENRTDVSLNKLKITIEREFKIKPIVFAPTQSIKASDKQNVSKDRDIDISPGDYQPSSSSSTIRRNTQMRENT